MTDMRVKARRNHTLIVTVCAVSMLLISAPAYSLSCLRVVDQYFFNCAANICKGEFRANEVRSGSPCGRRTVIEPVPDWATKFVNARMAEAEKSNQLTGIIQLSLFRGYYEPVPGTIEEFTKTLEARGVPAYKDYISMIEERDILLLREQWQRRADKTMAFMIIRWIVDLGSFLFCIFLLFRTAARYTSNTRQFFQRQKKRLEVAKPLMIQIGVFSIGTFMLLSQLPESYMIWLPPLVLLVWICEGALYAYHWLRRIKPLAEEL